MNEQLKVDLVRILAHSQQVVARIVALMVVIFAVVGWTGTPAQAMPLTLPPSLPTCPVYSPDGAGDTVDTQMKRGADALSRIKRADGLSSDELRAAYQAIVSYAEAVNASPTDDPRHKQAKYSLGCAFANKAELEHLLVEVLAAQPGASSAHPHTKPAPVRDGDYFVEEVEGVEALALTDTLSLPALQLVERTDQEQAQQLLAEPTTAEPLSRWALNYRCRTDEIVKKVKATPACERPVEMTMTPTSYTHHRYEPLATGSLTIRDELGEDSGFEEFCWLRGTNVDKVIYLYDQRRVQRIPITLPDSVSRQAISYTCKTLFWSPIDIKVLNRAGTWSVRGDGRTYDVQVWGMRSPEFHLAPYNSLR